jgi:hypothetical protein
LQSGDFFVDALPSAESYIVTEVLHDWADEQCVAILKRFGARRPTAPQCS